MYWNPQIEIPNSAPVGILNDRQTLRFTLEMYFKRLIATICDQSDETLCFIIMWCDKRVDA